jgi:hypothetical protein
VCVEPVALWKALEQACCSGFDLLSGNHIKNQFKRGQLYDLTTQVGQCAWESDLNYILNLVLVWNKCMLRFVWVLRTK